MVTDAKNFLKNLLGYFSTDRKPVVKRTTTVKSTVTTTTPLTAVKGIGKATATKLASVGIETVEKARTFTMSSFVETGVDTGLSPTMLRKYYKLFESHDNQVSTQ